MKKVEEKICKEIITKFSTFNKGERFLVGIAGVPGSGKTTLTKNVKVILEKMLLSMDSKAKCVLVPMDGFHYTKKELCHSEKPEYALKRRGAEFTFNSTKYLNLLRKIKKCEEFPIFAPSFDHAKGDPVEKDIKISKHHKIILCEGNYLFLTDPPKQDSKIISDSCCWSDICAIFDYRIYLHCDLEKAMKRVIKRHMSDLKLTKLESIARVDTNDRVNGLLISKSKKNADLTVNSIDFPN